MKRYKRFLSLFLTLGLAFVFCFQAEIYAETEADQSCAETEADQSCAEAEVNQGCAEAEEHQCYADIEGHWAYEYILYVIDKGYMEGRTEEGKSAEGMQAAAGVADETQESVEPLEGMQAAAGVADETQESVEPLEGMQTAVGSADETQAAVESAEGSQTASGAEAGKSDGEAAAVRYFEPAAGMTRQMLVTALYSMAQAYEKEEKVLYGIEKEPPFSDLTGNESYCDAVRWASDAGIVNGINGNFCPEIVVDRQTMSVMMFRTVSVLGAEPDTDWALALEYTDLEEMDDWAVDGIAYCAATGLMSGNPDGSFAPKRQLSRAEAAVILKRLDQKMSDRFASAAEISGQSPENEADERLEEAHKQIAEDESAVIF